MIHGEKIAGTRYAINYMMKMPGMTPYWIGHQKYMKRQFGEQLFNKWYERPNRSYKLYWRLHPDEYVLSFIG